jgi:hypothetical protein
LWEAGAAATTRPLRGHIHCPPVEAVTPFEAVTPVVAVTPCPIRMEHEGGERKGDTTLTIS